MPHLHLQELNIALDVFSLVVTLIIMSSCIHEFSRAKTGARHFLLFQASIAVALVADIIGWIGEGNPSLAIMTLSANTVMACACRIAIVGFMGYLTASLYANSRAAALVLNIFRILCVLSIIFCLGNAFFEYSFYVDAAGHYEHSGNTMMGVLYLLYPMLALFAVVLMAFFAKTSAKVSRVAFLIYTLFPVAGLVIDYVFHGISVTCAGFTVSIVAIYTSIYLTRQKQLEAQKNALMLSQINPHFVYNTLSTIAAMCDSSPTQAKYLTIDFSQYLRKNINSLSAESLIPFEQEMEHVACYLKIEKARFRDRLNVIYSVQCKDFSIPPLSVQPIVENAVKHGITKRADGGTIKITTYDADEIYIVEIIDDGVGFDTENTEMHVGIRNVRNRIRSNCRGEMSIKSTPGIGTRVTIEIPKTKGKRR